MPWKECNIMDERMRFVSRLLEGGAMSALCREFNISRKTGNKILGRYRDCGLEGLNDRSRRPYRQANQLPSPSRNRDCAAEERPSLRGVLPRSGSGCAGSTRIFIVPPSPRFTPSWIAMVWSNESPDDNASSVKALLSPHPISPTVCGALIIRVNSCWRADGTAIR